MRVLVMKGETVFSEFCHRSAKSDFILNHVLYLDGCIFDIFLNDKEEVWLVMRSSVLFMYGFSSPAQFCVFTYNEAFFCITR